MAAYLSALEGKGRGRGDVLDCDGEARRHAGELELEFEGELDDGYRVRKEVRDREAKTVKSTHYRLRWDEPYIALNSQSPVQLLALSRVMLLFRAKYAFPSGPRVAVSREVIYAFHRKGDNLIYEELEYTQGRLRRHASWEVERIF